MAHVLPAPVNGLIAILQARLALQSGSPELAKSLAQKGIDVLSQGKPSATSAPQEDLPALPAALIALLAIAQRRSGKPHKVQALENHNIADSAFAKLVDAN